MREHKHVSAADLEKWSELSSGLPSLFDSVVAVESMPHPTVDLKGLELRLVDVFHDGRPHHPVTLVVLHGDKLVVRLVFDRRRFRPAIAKAMLNQLGAVLASFAARPRQSLGSVDWVGEDEARKILIDWNRTERCYPREPSFHGSFEVRAAERPNTTALIFADGTMSYGELNARANLVASALQRRGIGPETPVALIMERSPEMVIAILGILKAGGAYVPIEPTFPAVRRQRMARTVEARVVITQPHLLRASTDVAADVVVVQRHDPLEAAASANPRSFVNAKNLVYVLFTSGSTGAPHGVMNTHGALSNRLLWMQDAMPLGLDDRVLHKTPFTFDVSVWELFWPLRTGATLVLARPDGHRDTSYLADFIERERITTVHFVPSMLEAFLGEPGLAQRCRSLRRVICSGEVLPKSLELRFYEQLTARLLPTFTGQRRLQ